MPLPGSLSILQLLPCSGVLRRAEVVLHYRLLEQQISNPENLTKSYSTTTGHSKDVAIPSSR
jgi:hypothetical protein